MRWRSARGLSAVGASSQSQERGDRYRQGLEDERRETEIENTEAVKHISTIIELANKALDESEELISEMHLECTVRCWQMYYGTPEGMSDTVKARVRDAERTITQLKIRIKNAPKAAPKRDDAGRFLKKSDKEAIEEIRRGVMKMHTQLVLMRRDLASKVDDNASMRIVVCRNSIY